MKIRGEVLSATRHFEFENVKQVREMFEQHRTEEYRNIPRGIDIFRASFGTQQSWLSLKQGTGNRGTGEPGNRGTGEPGNGGTGEPGNGGTGEPGNEGTGERGNRGTGERGNRGTGERGNRGTGERGNRGTGERGNGGTGEPRNRGTREPGNRGSALFIRENPTSLPILGQWKFWKAVIFKMQCDIKNWLYSAQTFGKVLFKCITLFRALNFVHVLKHVFIRKSKACVWLL